MLADLKQLRCWIKTWGGDKVALSHTRAQIGQMMGMMQQLLQARSADQRQHKDESGGTGRRDAHDDSGGAGRAPREEVAAGARVGTTTATGAEGRVSDHSSIASDGSRFTDDTGRRPEAPAGVGPMVNMQRGETRDPFIAGIAAYDGGGVSSCGFRSQSCVAPPVLKGEKEGFQEFKHEFLLKANMLDISGHFGDQGTRVVSVEDPLKQKAVSSRESF